MGPGSSGRYAFLCRRGEHYPGPVLLDDQGLVGSVGQRCTVGVEVALEPAQVVWADVPLVCSARMRTLGLGNGLFKTRSKYVFLGTCIGTGHN